MKPIAVRQKTARDGTRDDPSRPPKGLSADRCHCLKIGAHAGNIRARPAITRASGPGKGERKRFSAHAL
jgi:hypothetical protein